MTKVQSGFAIIFLIFISTLTGCLDANSDNDFSDEIIGCTYLDAMNYNESATLDDGSCVYPEPDVPILGCMYSDALNYNSLATEDDGSCRYPVVPDPILGCMYLGAFNFNSNATKDDGSCVYDSDGDGILDNLEIIGCSDSIAMNYDINATDEGICYFEPEYMMELNEFWTLLDCDNLDDCDVLGIVLNSSKNVIRFWSVLISEEDPVFGGNANTTGTEVWIGANADTETTYLRTLIRFSGDVSIDQTTVQNSTGINYRTGDDMSGAWYFARDEIYQFSDPLSDEEDSEDDEVVNDGVNCNEEGPTLDGLNSTWADNWNISTKDGVHMITANNGTWDLNIELEGNPVEHLKMSLIEVNGLESCGIQLLDADNLKMEVNPNYPRTSMTMNFENEEESETENTKTWGGNLGEDHSEEVYLNEITMQTGYEDDEGNFTVVADLSLIDQDSSSTDQCFIWSLTWSDSDNDGYTSSGDTYTVTRTDRVNVGGSCSDEYSNHDFQIRFYDEWAQMPTGGVFLPGFGFLSVISTLIIGSIFSGKKNEFC
ncbi:MAG: hypothetical protein CND89_04080 [Marine Group II euryarchaeote MED-G38]|nr:hypothetical protein [Euryarchaeota archaeon]OUV25383.1 MAG: hypothetical protein CBC57_05410 [Euryarchaeota archaeon TMED97]PDH22445.1 MAG: hypothetical protein CND89_04080 [Marine Group II euryarchaeote MED-G38]|tara:strand:+ start:20137 stop:21762 length:1626 start_codon:yes stop_codon:yes gene_type:complete